MFDQSNSEVEKLKKIELQLSLEGYSINDLFYR